MQYGRYSLNVSLGLYPYTYIKAKIQTTGAIILILLRVNSAVQSSCLLPFLNVHVKKPTKLYVLLNKRASKLGLYWYTTGTGTLINLPLYWLCICS